MATRPQQNSLTSFTKRIPYGIRSPRRKACWKPSVSTSATTPTTWLTSPRPCSPVPQNTFVRRWLSIMPPMHTVQIMFEPGNLLYFNPFIFPDGGDPKPKFFVVLGEVDETVLLASLPTSKDHIPSDVEVTSGCLEIPERMVNAYTFLANEVITENGFFFE